MLRIFFGSFKKEIFFGMNKKMPTLCRTIVWTYLLVFPPCSNPSNQNTPSEWFCVAEMPSLAFFGYSGSCKWPKLFCLNVFIGVPTLFHPFQPKIGPLGRFVWTKGYFNLLWPHFGPHRAMFGTFWVLQMASTGLSGCLHWCSNLVPPLPTQNRPSGPI